jgi:hypothetical protein
MKAEAQKILGESAPVATTREQLAAAFDRLLQRYPKEYNLLHQRAIMYVKQGDLVAAHADLAAAFDLHRAQKLMAFDLVDWYALICQLTGDDKGLMQAHKATHELIEELRTSDIYLKRNFIRSYCTAPNMQDYADIVKFADDEFGETDNASLVVAQSIAEFRNGKAVQIAPEYSEEDVDSAVYTCYFRVLSELGKGNRKSALERLDEALAFSAKMVPTPDGPDFKWSNRAHAWVISQALLAEVRQVIELGARDFDRETVRAVADLRQNFEGRFGQQLARKLLARVGSALVEINADPTDASPTDAKSTDRPTTQIVPDGK